MNTKIDMHRFGLDSERYQDPQLSNGRKFKQETVSVSNSLDTRLTVT